MGLPQIDLTAPDLVACSYQFAEDSVNRGGKVKWFIFEAKGF